MTNCNNLMCPRTACGLLEVKGTATKEEISAAYKQLALKFHPDKNPHINEQATEVFQLIQHAKDLLFSTEPPYYRPEESPYPEEKEQALKELEKQKKKDEEERKKQLKKMALNGIITGASYFDDSSYEEWEHLQDELINNRRKEEKPEKKIGSFFGIRGYWVCEECNSHCMAVRDSSVCGNCNQSFKAHTGPGYSIRDGNITCNEFKMKVKVHMCSCGHPCSQHSCVFTKRDAFDSRGTDSFNHASASKGCKPVYTAAEVDLNSGSKNDPKPPVKEDKKSRRKSEEKMMEEELLLAQFGIDTADPAFRLHRNEPGVWKKKIQKRRQERKEAEENAASKGKTTTPRDGIVSDRTASKTGSSVTDLVASGDEADIRRRPNAKPRVEEKNETTCSRNGNTASNRPSIPSSIPVRESIPLTASTSSNNPTAGSNPSNTPGSNPLSNPLANRNKRENSGPPTGRTRKGTAAIPTKSPAKAPPPGMVASHIAQRTSNDSTNSDKKPEEDRTEKKPEGPRYDTVKKPEGHRIDKRPEKSIFKGMFDNLSQDPNSRAFTKERIPQEEKDRITSKKRAEDILASIQADISGITKDIESASIRSMLNSENLTGEPHDSLNAIDDFFTTAALNGKLKISSDEGPVEGKATEPAKLASEQVGITNGKGKANPPKVVTATPPSKVLTGNETDSLDNSVKPSVTFKLDSARRKMLLKMPDKEAYGLGMKDIYGLNSNGTRKESTTEATSSTRKQNSGDSKTDDKSDESNLRDSKSDQAKAEQKGKRASFASKRDAKNAAKSNLTGVDAFKAGLRNSGEPDPGKKTKQNRSENDPDTDKTDGAEDVAITVAKKIAGAYQKNKKPPNQAQFLPAKTSNFYPGSGESYGHVKSVVDTNLVIKSPATGDAIKNNRRKFSSFLARIFEEDTDNPEDQFRVEPSTSHPIVPPGGSNTAAPRGSFSGNTAHIATSAAHNLGNIGNKTTRAANNVASPEKWTTKANAKHHHGKISARPSKNIVTNSGSTADNQERLAREPRERNHEKEQSAIREKSAERHTINSVFFGEDDMFLVGKFREPTNRGSPRKRAARRHQTYFSPSSSEDENAQPTYYQGEFPVAEGDDSDTGGDVRSFACRPGPGPKVIRSAGAKPKQTHSTRKKDIGRIKFDRLMGKYGGTGAPE